jgi:hypothetical protein
MERQELSLMTKFLNNEDGEYLKQFISDKVEAIISYPRKYFQEFIVTTVDCYFEERKQFSECFICKSSR